MNVTPFPVVHIHVPVWVCVVALDDGDRCQHCGALWITCGCDC